MPNTFLEKTIDDWLSKTNELGYQLPFCQLLISRGMRVVHISKHNAFEQGKDVISLDADGQCHAYQLKGGNISLKTWRDIVRPEVDDLIEVRIKHPSVDVSRPHKSYLVTNGYLDDTVRILIDDLNAGRWKESPLRVITRGELLPEFIELSGTFVPQELSDYRAFLELYFADGRGTLDREKFSKFVEEVTGLRHDNRTNHEQRKRAIAAAVVYTGYILEPFRAVENHVSAVHALVILAATILACAERFNLPRRYWEDSFDAVTAEIDATGARLASELAGRSPEFKDSPYDGAIGPYRRQLALSCYLAHFLSRLLKGEVSSTQVDDTVLAPRNFHFWGEGAVPDFLLRCFLSLMIRQDSADAFGSVLAATDILIKSNGHDATDEGICSPFYTAEEVAMQVLGMADEPIYESFVGSSYTLSSLVLVLSRYDRRQDISRWWPHLTHISHAESVPDERWEELVWRAERGVLRSWDFPPQHTWAALQAWARSEDNTNVPSVLKQKPYFIPHFLTVYPHRLRPEITRFLTEFIDGMRGERRPTSR